MVMTDTRGPGAGNTPAATELATMDPEAFGQYVRDHLGPDADPAVWDTLTEPPVIARTKTYLGALHADIQSQVNQANQELEVIRAECLQRGPEGKQDWFDAKADQAQWRQRTAGFRRLVERRIAFVRSRAAQAPRPEPSPPGLTKTARVHNRAALEQLARAVAEHQRRVLSGEGDEGDDETLWACLTTITAMVRACCGTTAHRMAGLPRRTEGER